MSFVIGQIVNTPAQAVPTSQVNPFGVESLYLTENGELEGNYAQKVVLNTTEPTVIDYLEWATNSQERGTFIIEYYNGESYVQIGMLNSNGNNVTGFTPLTINLYGTNLFDVLVYNTETNNYKFSLSRPLSFPKGVRVRIQNPGNDPINISCRVYAREL